MHLLRLLSCLQLPFVSYRLVILLLFLSLICDIILDGVRIRVRKIIPIKPFVDIGKEITYSLLVYGRHSDAFIILVAITNTLSSSSFELLPLPYVL